VTATYGYTNNGKTAYVADGNNNRTSYVYDGFDRMVQTQYPSSSKGTNSSNTGDYEAVLAYDANGNPTQTRLRDGNTIGLTYDNLGRLTSRTVQTNPSYPYDYPVSYSYNLAGQITAISRPGDGNTISYGYDALGRQTSEVQASGTVSYQYDQASRRIRQTWNDGFYVNYDYDNTGLVTKIRENGATSGVGVLASYSYDNAGRRTGVTYGNGTSRSYGYDAISRLTGLQMTFPNASGYNHTIGGLNGTGTAISYSPASQIASIAKSNDSFAWTSATNADRNYTTNGLNQYTSDGQVSFGYDGRGNLTSSGVLSFGYNKENQLISGPTGRSITIRWAASRI
jgi:YD repeat-containing protein